MVRVTAASVLLIAVTALVGPGTGRAAAAGGASGDEMDLQVADTTVHTSETRCDESGPYVDEGSAPPLSIGGARPGSSRTAYVCVHNAGDEAAAVTVEVAEARSTETGCTNDEPRYDPDGAGCGTVGELADDVRVRVAARGVGGSGRCDGSAPGAGVVRFDGVADGRGRSVGPPLPAGAFACYEVDAAYSEETSEAAVVANQTDRVTWRFRFTAGVGPAPEVALEKDLAALDGTTATWALRVTNRGPGPLAGPLTVVDHLPDGLALRSAGGDGFECVADGGDVVCQRAGWLLEAERVTVVLVTEITRAGTLTNRAEVLGTDSRVLAEADARLVAAPGPGGAGTSGGLLARTGADSGDLLAAGLLCLGLGVALVALHRRRRPPHR